MSERPTCELCGHPMPEGEEMFKFHGYSGPCPGPRTKPMGGVPEVIELHGEKWVRIDVVRKLEEQLAAAEARSERCSVYENCTSQDDCTCYAHLKDRLAAAEAEIVNAREAARLVFHKATFIGTAKEHNRFPGWQKIAEMYTWLAQQEDDTAAKGGRDE